VLLVVALLCLGVLGLEKAHHQKKHLKELLSGKTKLKTHQKHELKHTDRHHSKHHHASHHRQKTREWDYVDPEITPDTAADIFNWFTDSQDFPVSANLPLPCIDMALCMMNNVQWGSHVMDYIPQNFPTNPKEIKSELKAIYKRITSDTSLYASVKASVLYSHADAVRMCKMSVQGQPEIDPINDCIPKDCSKVFDHPAMRSPAGDASTTNSVFGCSNYRECEADATCSRFGGTAICEHYTFSSNKCRCMWILPDELSERLCGKPLEELSKFDCGGRCNWQ